jgi:hypothetical protein
MLYVFIKREREKPIYIYRFSNWVGEEQYMLLESLYLQIPLISIFTYIYVYRYTYPYRWLKFEVHITYDIILKKIIERFIQ